MNNTTNKTVTEDSGSLLDSVTDMLMGSPEMLFLALLIGAIGAILYVKVPEFRFYVLKYLRRHNSEVQALIDEHLTPKMKEVMSAEVEKRLKNDVLKNIVLGEVDHLSKAANKEVKAQVRTLLKNQ